MDVDFEEFKREHEQLAFTAILNSLEGSKCAGLRKQIEKSLENYENGTHNYGIVSKVQDRKVLFIHKTFQEYFISCFLIRNMNEFEIEELVFEKILVEDQYKTIRLFLNAKEYLKSTERKHFELNKCLFVCTSEGLEKISEYLVENGADVNAKDRQNKTAMIHASESGRLEMVKCLVKNGADVNAKDNLNDTALMAASFNGHLETVKYLVENGAQLNAKREDGVTELMYASERGHLEMVKYLVEKGANVNATDIFNRTASTMASERGHLEIVKRLVEKGAEFDVHATYENGMTALMQVSENDHLEMVRYLVENGAKVNGAGKYGRTALILASKKGHLEIVKYLLQNGADVNATDDNGKTALDYAFRGIFFKHFEVKNFLLDYISVGH